MEDSSQTGIHALLKVAFGKMMLELVLVLVLMVILVMSSLYDYRERRIPNLLAFSGWLLGPLIYFAMSGVVGVKISLFGLLIMFALSFPFWLLGSMGAGDVKLLATVGALVGSGKALYILFFIAVAGFFYAVSVVLYRTLIGRFARDQQVGKSATDKSDVDDGGLAESGVLNKKKIPYAIPIAFGTLTALLLTYK